MVDRMPESEDAEKLGLGEMTLEEYDAKVVRTQRAGRSAVQAAPQVAAGLALRGLPVW